MQRITIVGAILLVLGLALSGVSFYEVAQFDAVMNGPVAVHARSPELSFLGTYDGAVGRNLTLVGHLKSSSCCISFDTFTYQAYNNWVANNFESTNASNSPFVVVPASSVDAPNDLSGSFSHDLPSSGYFLVFFNDNKSLWHSNSNLTSQVMANIGIEYVTTPYGLVIYPGLVMVGLGAIAATGPLLRRSGMSRLLKRDAVLAALLILVAMGFLGWSLTLYPSGPCGGQCPAPFVRLVSVNCTSSQGSCNFTLSNRLPADYPYNDIYTEGSAILFYNAQRSAMQCGVVPLGGGGANSTVACSLLAKAPLEGTPFTGDISISGSSSISFAGNFTR